MKLEFPRNILEKYAEYQISWKSIHWKPSCSMRTDRHTQYDEADSRFLLLSEHAWKSYVLSTARFCVLYYCHSCYGHIQYFWRFTQPKWSVFTARYETESLYVIIHVSRNLWWVKYTCTLSLWWMGLSVSNLLHANSRCKYEPLITETFDGVAYPWNPQTFCPKNGIFIFSHNAFLKANFGYNFRYRHYYVHCTCLIWHRSASEMLPQLKIPLIVTYFQSRLDFFLGQYGNTEKHFERRFPEIKYKESYQWNTTVW